MVDNKTEQTPPAGTNGTEPQPASGGTGPETTAKAPEPVETTHSPQAKAVETVQTTTAQKVAEAVPSQQTDEMAQPTTTPVTEGTTNANASATAAPGSTPTNQEPTPTPKQTDKQPGFFKRAAKATGRGIVKGLKAIGSGALWTGKKVVAIPVGGIRGIYGTQKQYREESAARTKIVNETLEGIKFLQIGRVYYWTKKVIAFPFKVAAAPLLAVGRVFESFAYHSGLQNWFAENVKARYKKGKAWLKGKFSDSEEQ